MSIRNISTSIVAAAAAAAAVAALTFAGAANAATSVVKSFEAPGVQNTTVPFLHTGVETFDGRGTGTKSFANDFGTGGQLVASFQNMPIRKADLWGGAGGVGLYPALFNPQVATISFNRGVDYMGFWLSALSGGHTISVYDGASLVASYTSANIFTGLPNNPAYFGNPTPNFAGQAGHERFAFVNLTAQGGTFDKIVFSQSGGGGLEFDNFTVGANAVPEPATWIMMILGFGAVGAALRRRGLALA